MSRLGDVIVDAGVVLEVLFDGRQSLLPPRATLEPILPFRSTPFRDRTETQREGDRRTRRARRRQQRRES